MCLHNLLHIHYMQAFWTYISTLMSTEYFTVFTRKTFLLYRNHHSSTPFWNKLLIFLHISPASWACYCVPSSCCLLLPGSCRHPHFAGRKIRGPFPSPVVAGTSSGPSPPRAPVSVPPDGSEVVAWLFSSVRLWTGASKQWAAWVQ